MQRIFPNCAALSLAVLLAGCCYKPPTCDPITGIMYGGGLEPCCCGPLDPFGQFCNGCQQPLLPSIGSRCGSPCGGGWGWGGGGGGWGCFGWGRNCCGGTNWCQPSLSGGLYSGCCPQTPTYGGVVPPGGVMDGGIYGGPILDGGVVGGGTVIHPYGTQPYGQPVPGPMSQPSAAPRPDSQQPPSQPATPPADSETSGAIVPWPMLPPSAQQPATQPVRFQSPTSRFIPARR